MTPVGGRMAGGAKLEVARHGLLSRRVGGVQSVALPPRRKPHLG